MLLLLHFHDHLHLLLLNLTSLSLNNQSSGSLHLLLLENLDVPERVLLRNGVLGHVNARHGVFLHQAVDFHLDLLLGLGLRHVLLLAHGPGLLWDVQMVEDELGGGGHLHAQFDLFLGHGSLVALGIFVLEEFAAFEQMFRLTLLFEQVCCLSDSELHFNKVSNTELQRHIKLNSVTLLSESNDLRLIFLRQLLLLLSLGNALLHLLLD